MRRLIPITAFALCLAVPLWAQHGGGHVGGGGHGSFGGGHGGGFAGHVSSGGGHIGGSHFSGGTRTITGVSRGFAHGPAFAQRSFSRDPFLHDRFRGSRSGHFRLRNNCYGYGCRGYGYPWWYAGYYDPWWWWGSDSSYDDDYERDRALADEMNQQSLEEQRMLRQEEADGDQDLYARSAPAAPRSSEASSPQPATVLVFRDQHKREIQNYAIVGQTLWNFASPRTEKISLADLDLVATVKANDERGISFSVPGTAGNQNR